MIDRRAFLRRIVPAATGIVVAPAVALELLEAERRRRYWPGWGPGRSKGAFAEAMERQFADMKRRFQLETDRQVYGESPLTPLHELDRIIRRVLREPHVREAMVASANRQSALLLRYDWIAPRSTVGRSFVFPVEFGGRA